MAKNNKQKNSVKDNKFIKTNLKVPINNSKKNSVKDNKYIKKNFFKVALNINKPIWRWQWATTLT